MLLHMPSMLHSLWKDFINVILPRTCVVCGRPLVPMEQVCCTTCAIEIPRTNYKACEGNPIERIFWGKIPIIHANAFMHYHPHSGYARLITQLKYNNRKDFGMYLGQLMAEDLRATDFFKDIDLIIPLPLAKSRHITRGYNQSEYIAKGIQQVVQLPIETSHIRRTKANQKQTQTHKHLRHENVKDIFALTKPCNTDQAASLSPLELLHPTISAQTSSHPLTNKHILLLDDIITTGASLLSCAKVLSQIPGIRISILCAGVAGQHRWGPRLPEDNKI